MYRWLDEGIGRDVDGTGTNWPFLALTNTCRSSMLSIRVPSDPRNSRVATLCFVIVITLPVISGETENLLVESSSGKGHCR